ncbi:MAG: GatB/YqeY domain-containing protein [Deltaproteobacteria bacterium]|nr:GatB/YqeY domain-containing protein [Deltaproteobacteria bacterium]
MSLKKTITDEMVKAMKSGEKLRLSTIRFLLAAVKNKEIDLRREITDEELWGVLSTLSKQRLESIEQFKKGGREELAEKEEKELEILRGFMPAQLSEAEIRDAVKKAAEETGAAAIKDMGRLMKAVMEKVKGRADGKLVQEIVKGVLSGS